MNTPIINPQTLTEEQRKEIKSIYDEVDGLRVKITPLSMCRGIYAKEALTAIFGTELFEKGE